MDVRFENVGDLQIVVSRVRTVSIDVSIGVDYRSLSLRRDHVRVLGQACYLKPLDLHHRYIISLCGHIVVPRGIWALVRFCLQAPTALFARPPVTRRCYMRFTVTRDAIPCRHTITEVKWVGKQDRLHISDCEPARLSGEFTE